MTSMNGTMSHAKMYSGEHSDVQMIAFLHSHFNPKYLRETEQRDFVHVVKFVRCICPRQDQDS